MGKKVTDKDGNEIDLDEVVAGIIASKGKGDATKALEILAEENHELRAKNRELKAGQSTLKENEVVVTKEDKELLEKYRAYGAPNDLQKKLDEAIAAQEQVGTLHRQIAVGKAASIYGLKDTVLNDLVKNTGLKLEVGEVDHNENGTTTKRPAVFVLEDGKEKKALDLVVKERFADYLPALTVQQGGGQGTGTQWPAQRGGGQGPGNPGNNSKTAGQAYVQGGSNYVVPGQQKKE